MYFWKPRWTRITNGYLQTGFQTKINIVIRSHVQMYDAETSGTSLAETSGTDLAETSGTNLAETSSTAFADSEAITLDQEV